MKEQNLGSPQLEGETQREGKASCAVQSEYVTEGPKWRLLEEGKDVSGKRMQQRWEAQWQEFLKTLQSPNSASGNLQLSEKTPWDDTKAFLASFEQVAEACRWPREEWVIRLLPALSGEAEQAFQSMESTDKEDYGKVKAAILRADALRMEMQRQHFRQFCCQEIEDPRRIYNHLQELCHQWLKPDRRSKEQILELLILEQFLASLPPDVQSWIQVGGPDTCSQAVALVEDFLMTRQEAESARWQGPLQDVCVGSLEVEEVSPNATQGQIYKEAKQIEDAETALLGSGIKCPSHSISLLPPEGQEVTETGLGEGLLNLKETGVSLHMVERTLTQPGQQTMFWQVLQEDGGNVQPVGDGKATPLKAENPQRGGNELEETPGAVPLINQGKVPQITEMHDQRCNESRCWIKMEKSQQGETVPEEAQKVLAETIQWNFPVTADMHELRCECKSQQKRAMEREREYSEVAEGLTGADNKNSAESTEGRKPLFSKYGRKYRYRSELAVMHPGENPYECPAWEEEIQTKCCLNKPEEVLKRAKQCVPSKSKEGFHLRDEGVGRQNCHPEKKPYECHEDGKSFSHKQTLQKSQNTHSGRKLHECSVCRKSFTYRAELTRHLRIHTGEKPFECSQCGRCFRQRVHLIGHQRIHTGEKPFKCPECGRGFSRKDKLIGHQRTHRTFIRSLSSVGGKNCGVKGTLMKHQSIYEGH